MGGGESQADQAAKEEWLEEATGLKPGETGGEGRRCQEKGMNGESLVCSAHKRTLSPYSRYML